MGRGRFLFTSESVTEGHPDKMADQIADALLDAVLGQDPYGRVALEAALKTGFVLVMGEMTTTARLDIPSIVRETICDIGYVDSAYGFDGRSCGVLVAVEGQSPDIAQGVDRPLEARSGEESGEDELGAGDQGMMMGFACRETPELMPLPITLAHRLARQLARVRREGVLPYLRPDGKTQVTVEYEGGLPRRVDTVVVSAQHAPEVSDSTLRLDIVERVIRPVIPEEFLDRKTRILVNPTGRFVLGGPQADSGLTGRKIMVDTYGSYARHGGGAFSGKDPTKVDRSGAYAARWVAKNLVAAGLAERCEVQIAYVIGVARPVSIMVETFGTGALPDEEMAHLVQRCFDLRPAAIIKELGLRRPLYRQVAAYGHFGRSDLDLPWERVDRADLLRREARLGALASNPGR